MNKKFLLAMVLLILMIAGVIIFSLWPKKKLPEIKIANITLLSLIATEKDFFEKEGLQVKLEEILPEDSVSALLAGEVDYATFYRLFAKLVIEASLRNAPLKTIMFTTKHEVYSLVAQPKLKLKDIKTIGIFSRYTSQHYQILKFIENNNLKIAIIAPKTEEGFWTTEKLQNLLLSGEVDAILTFSENAPHLQSQGFSILDVLIEESPSCLSVRNDKIEKEPEEVQKVVRALEKTMEFIVTRPEETKGFLLKLLEQAKREENPAILYPLFKAMYDRKNVPYDEGAELLIKIAKAGEFETVQEVEEQIVTPEDLQKVFDFRFVK